jgi:SagB-type dehydrogenase family enzyme
MVTNRLKQIQKHTEHSYASIRTNPHYLNWDTQPRNYKRYPEDFPRFPLQASKELQALSFIGGISYEKVFPNGSYYLRTVPSAGGLFPCEVYIQIRSVEGWQDGIYHYEPHSARLALLHTIDNEGVEFYFADKHEQKGLIFLISAVHFRSSWKYRDRSIRYILLDSGHQLGAIYATLQMMEKEEELHFDFDKEALNGHFHFKDQEFFTCALSATTVGANNNIQEPPEQIPFVDATDYFEKSDFVERAYHISAIYQTDPIRPHHFFAAHTPSVLQRAIYKRRSIRAFTGMPITKEVFEGITESLYSFAQDHGIDIYYTLHRVDHVTPGLYRNGILQKEGDFQKKSRYLSLEQDIGGDSAVTFYFTSSDRQHYQKVYILSGFIAHIIYLRTEIEGIGCSGIGAYFDKETQEFLSTQNDILYLLAIGR